MNNLFFKNFQIPYIECRYTTDSKLHYKPHLHNSLSIGMVIDGNTNFTLQNNSYLLTPEFLAVINPNSVHCCNPVKNEARSYTMLYLDKQWCFNIQSTIFDNINEYIPINKVIIQDKNLINLYLNLINILFSNTINLEKEEAIENFAITLFTSYCNKNKINSIKKNEKKIKTVMEYMQENFNQNITIKELANIANLSPYHLIRTFHKTTGITPKNFLFNIRIEKVKKLLNTNKSISEIALETGFYDQSHLNRVFKQIVACTPYQYKKGIKN